MASGTSPHSSGRASSPSLESRYAEVARSVLARASSAELTWLDGDAVRPGGTVAGVVLDDGDRAPAGPATVEIADPAPLAVRDRIRSRVRLHGYAALDEQRTATVRMRIQGVELEHGGQTTWLSAGQLRAARIDPLAQCEAALLAHLAGCHGELVEALAHLLPEESVAAARDVVPLALDRHGFTFRVVTDAGHEDVELPFPAPAASRDEIRCSMHALATAAAAGRRRTSHRRPAGLRGLTDVFRSGPAAARLCSPADGSGA